MRPSCDFWASHLMINIQLEIKRCRWKQHVDYNPELLLNSLQFINKTADWPTLGNRGQTVFVKFNNTRKNEEKFTNQSISPGLDQCDTIC